MGPGPTEPGIVCAGSGTGVCGNNAVHKFGPTPFKTGATLLFQPVGPDEFNTLVLRHVKILGWKIIKYYKFLPHLLAGII